MNICVYGASSNVISDVYVKAVEDMCTVLAKRGHSLIFGGGASGLMGAAARGFRAGGGKVTGVSPEFFDVDGILDDKCDEFIYTDTMRERKKMLEEKSDCFIVSPGGVGTYDEFFEILTLKQIGIHSKPIVLFNINGYFNEFSVLMNKALSERMLTSYSINLYKITDSPDELIDYIENYKSDVATVSETKYLQR